MYIVFWQVFNVIFLLPLINCWRLNSGHVICLVQDVHEINIKPAHVFGNSERHVAKVVLMVEN